LIYALDILESSSISIPAISLGVFQVSQIDVAHAIYNALVEFNGRRPNRVQEVSIVNIDAETTGIIRKEFAEKFEKTPTVLRLVKDYNSVLFIRDQGPTGIDQSSPRENEPRTEIIGDEELFVLQRRCKKEYIPEKYTFFWKAESPFSQHHKCSFVIDRITIIAPGSG